MYYKSSVYLIVKLQKTKEIIRYQAPRLFFRAEKIMNKIFGNTNLPTICKQHLYGQLYTAAVLDDNNSTIIFVTYTVEFIFSIHE